MIKKFNVNLDGEDYVVGDIHSCYDVLMNKLKEINFNFEKDRLFSVGDLVDRGNQYKEVVSLIDEKWFFSVRGNHDQFIIDRFNDDRVLNFRYSHLTPAETHNKYGTGSWFEDYSIEEQSWFYNKLRSLPFIIEVEMGYGKTVGICHAGVPTNFTSWEDMKSDMNNSNTRELVLRGRKPPKVKLERVIKDIYATIHGHTAHKEVKQIGNQFWIDTLNYNFNPDNWKFNKEQDITVLKIKILVSIK